MLKSSNMSWVIVSDIKKAKKFFVEVLGFKEQNFHEDFGWAELSGHEEGGARIGLGQASQNQEMKAGENAIITITVDDIEKVRAEYQSKGVNLIGEVMEVPGHVKLQLFTDQDGNKFQLVETI